MWRTIGHDRALSVLRRGLSEGRLSHAYLLAGPRQVGKMTLAKELAQALNCTGEERPCGECNQCSRIARGLHADVQVVGVDSNAPGDGRSRVAISIEQVREVQREAALKPFEGRHRVFIFDGAEHLSEEAANSLLKTLEEPPDQVALVLLASDSGALVPTVVSRCQLLELRPVPRPLISRNLVSRHDADPARADEIARLSEGRPGWAFEAATDLALVAERSERLEAIEGTVEGGLEERFDYAANLAFSFARNRDLARQELALWLAWWRDVMLVKERAPNLVTHVSRIEILERWAAAFSSRQVAQAISTVLDTIDHLELNVNPRLALEEMVLAIPRP